MRFDPTEENKTRAFALSWASTFRKHLFLRCESDAAKLLRRRDSGGSEVFVSFCSSFLPTVFDRGVSGYVRLSVLWGLTDFLWSGGMCESWKTLAERTADQNTLGLLGLTREEDDDIGGEGLVFEGRRVLSSHVYRLLSRYFFCFKALNVLRLGAAGNSPVHCKILRLDLSSEIFAGSSDCQPLCCCRD